VGDGPLSWSEVIPSWPDDYDRAPTDPAATMPSSAPSPATGAGGDLYAFRFDDQHRAEGPPMSDASRTALRSAFLDHDDDQWDEHAAGGTRRLGAGAFDPGRRGVKTLAAVAAVVILVAAVLAWRARPRVDPVAPPPVAQGLPAQAAGAGPAGGGAAGRSSAAEVVLAVAGKVRRPGLVRLPAGSRVADALQAAGGADPGVDVAMLNLARKVADGELILVGVTPPPGTVVATGAAGAPAAAGTAQGPVNLNTATLAQLDTLPGVGPVLAQRILDARDARGGFTSVSDLRKVDGIGDSRYQQLKDLVTV
jgi:competence protein ComEA